MKQIDALSGQRVVPSSRVAPRLLFAQDRPSGQDVIELTDVTFAYDDNPPVFEKLSLRVDRGDRLAVVGRNGIGKSTLVRLMQGELSPQNWNR